MRVIKHEFKETVIITPPKWHLVYTEHMYSPSVSMTQRWLCGGLWEA